MKILWIDDTIGEEDLHITSRKEMINSLKRLGNKVETIFLTRREEKKLNEIKLVKYDYKLHFKIIKELIKSKSEVVILSSKFIIDGIIYKWIINKVINKKKIFNVDVRSIPVDISSSIDRLREGNFFLKLKLATKLLDSLTFITYETKNEIERRCGRILGKTFIWTSGVNLKHFYPREGEVVERIKNNLKLKNKFVLMYHGVFSPYRGLENLVKAMKLIKKENTTLVLIGSGPYEEKLNEMIKKLKIGERCKIVNKISYEEMPFYISIAHVGVLPFPNLIWWEVSSPLKLLEYLAMERCVILTKIKAHKNIIKNEECGFFIENNKPETIAKEINKVSEMSEKEIKRRGERGRKIVEKNFSWEYIGKELNRYITEKLMK